tara:strand:- start:4116 stop:5360 length:1245 start_codon:yes stop_codon:yes gene_type:complete
MFTFRVYQTTIIKKGVEICAKHKFVYLSMEVRTGKTLTSMGIAEELGCKNVLFVTKKKAISSIEHDYKLLNPSFEITVINYESLHKVKSRPSNRFDYLVIDEAHSLGAFPKPSKRAKDIKNLISTNNNPYVCLMSGTPTPESYSQLYHQVYGIPTNPFKNYVSFYKFAKDYVKVTQKIINSVYINDYSKGTLNILYEMKPYTISFTQKEAGFVNQIDEEILNVKMKPLTYELTKQLSKYKVITGVGDTILADTPAKMMQKLHQMYSGTIICESGNALVLDDSKAIFIKEHFKNKKIAIFYKFRQEYKALKSVFEDTLCNTVEEFCNTDKCIALQIVSGREGISLKEAEAIVYYNIDFSATSYWQSRDRMTTKDRRHSKIYWVFSEDGIEKDIYKTVIKKKDYTVRHFKRDLLTL